VKDTLRDLVVERAELGIEPRSLVREYLQARILGSLQRAGAMMSIAFHGGTALRFLYGLPRFSEDLDFALEDPNRGFALRDGLRFIRSELEAEGYRVDLRVNDKNVVNSGWVRFPGLLHEVGLSPHREEALRVKIELDTEPPAGAELETTLVRRFVTLRLLHHDRSSLLAGKLHAVLQGSWTKGGDLFDLLWYLSDSGWPEPNLDLLNNALLQTGWGGERLLPENWRNVVRERLRELDWPRVVSDVRPFLEPPADIELLTLENMLTLI
jgi:hypothetical protein